MYCLFYVIQHLTRLSITVVMVSICLNVNKLVSGLLHVTYECHLLHISVCYTKTKMSTLIRIRTNNYSNPFDKTL